MKLDEAQRKAKDQTRIPEFFEWFDTVADDFCFFNLTRVEDRFLIYTSEKTGQIEAVVLPKIMYNLLIY